MDLEPGARLRNWAQLGQTRAGFEDALKSLELQASQAWRGPALRSVRAFARPRLPVPPAPEPPRPESLRDPRRARGGRVHEASRTAFGQRGPGRSTESPGRTDATAFRHGNGRRSDWPDGCRRRRKDQSSGSVQTVGLSGDTLAAESSGRICRHTLRIQSYLLRYGDWRHCYVGARRVQSYLLRRYDWIPRDKYIFDVMT